MKRTDITIITPIRDKLTKHLDIYLESILPYKCKIIICNDLSKEDRVKEYEVVINKYRELGLDITFFTPEKRVYLAGGVYAALEYVKTPYVMRLDADDKMLEFPPIHEITEDADIYTHNAFPIGYKDLLRSRRGFALTIMKKEVMKELYKEWETINCFQFLLPEDMFAWTKLHILNKFKVQRLSHGFREIYSKHDTVNSLHRKVKDGMNAPTRLCLILKLIYMSKIIDSFTEEKYIKHAREIKEVLKTNCFEGDINVSL